MTLMLRTAFAPSAALALLALSACLGSEVGNPPFDPEAPMPSIDDARLIEDIGGVGPRQVEVPVDAVAGLTAVELTAFEGDGLPVSMTERDGSFIAAAPRAGVPIRLVALLGDTRRAPDDFRTTDELGARIEVSEGCLELETRDLEVSGSTSMQVRNRCGEVVELSLRLLGARFMVAPSSDALAAGETGRYELVATGNAPDLLLIEADRATPYAVTLRPSP